MLPDSGGSLLAGRFGQHVPGSRWRSFCTALGEQLTALPGLSQATILARSLPTVVVRRHWPGRKRGNRKHRFIDSLWPPSDASLPVWNCDGGVLMEQKVGIVAEIIATFSDAVSLISHPDSMGRDGAA